MSMLTPPGMGGKYKITGNAYPRMRRRRRGRTALAGAALLTTTGVLAWGGLQLVEVFTGVHRADAAQKSRCGTGEAAGKTVAKGSGTQGSDHSAAAPAHLPAITSITVNVYNATPRTGLAKQISEELKKRGFKIGKVGNASPEFDKKVKESAVLLGGSSAKPTLTVLGTHITGTRVEQDRRKGASVDLIIGKGFSKLQPAADAEKALAALAAPPSPKPSTRC